MNVVAIQDIEDCFDGSYIKELLFDEPLPKEFIESLGTLGRLQYFPDFARPFFKVIVPKIAEFKGVQGNCTMRVLLYNQQGISWLKEVVSRIHTTLEKNTTA